VNQSSKPGATTPMAGIANGPATSWKSMAVDSWWSDAPGAPVDLAARGGEVGRRETARRYPGVR
jgi:hypothetical protein